MRAARAAARQSPAQRTWPRFGAGRSTSRFAIASLAVLLSLQPVVATPPRVGENISKLTLLLDPDAADRLSSLPAALESEEDVTISHRTRSPAVLLLEVLSYDPDANSGWHYHPGVSLVTVADGTVDWYDANCVRQVHKAGEFFVEREWAVHLSHNSAATPARIIQTFIIKKGLSYKIPVPPPACAAALGLQ